MHGYIGCWTSRKMSQQPKKLRSCLGMTKQKIEMWDTQHSISVVVSSWDPKGLLSMIDMKIAEYVKHAFHAGMLRQAVGSASAYPLLVAGSVGLFGASVVMKEAQ